MFLLTSLFALLSTIIGVTGDAPTIYVYAYSWTPGFCYNTEYPGCSDSLPYWGTNFTIHGLWPQYIDKGYPSSCTNEPFDTNIPNEVGEDTMIQYWPDVQYTVSDPQYDSFWIHEWSKHGTCTGLTQLQYFNEAIQLTQRIPTPTILSESVGKNISATVLRNDMGGEKYVALQCKNQILTGAFTCWNQTNGIPTTQIMCPSSVVKEDTCILSDDIQVVKLE